MGLGSGLVLFIGNNVVACMFFSFVVIACSRLANHIEILPVSSYDFLERKVKKRNDDNRKLTSWARGGIPSTLSELKT